MTPNPKIGNVYGNWTVVEKVKEKWLVDRVQIFWLCKCECGVEKEITSHQLRYGKTRRCRDCYSLSRKGKPTSQKKAPTQNWEGKVFGAWTVLGKWRKVKYETTYQWLCQCACGVKKYQNISVLKRGRSTNCGCGRLNDKTGNIFGHWKVIGPYERRGKRNYLYWRCECVCGKIKWLSASYLSSKEVSHCGCLSVSDNPYPASSPEGQLWYGARVRARQKDLEFNLDEGDINIPTHCPLLGVKLRKGSNQAWEYSPTLDRIDPKQGYVKGNVWVVSKRANVIKNDASLEDLKAIVCNLEKKLQNS